MKKLLFVCSGNTCRSPMAEKIFKFRAQELQLSKKFRFSSAGLYAEIGQPMTKNAVLALKNLGLKRVTHTVKQFEPEMIYKFDIIIVMTEAHKRAIGNFKNVYSLGELCGYGDVIDPFGGKLDTYKQTAQMFWDAFDVIFDVKNV